MIQDQQAEPPQDDSSFLAIHRRLLSNDPTAPSELAEAVLDKIIARLHKANPSIDDQDIVQTAATDAVVSYIKKPQQYDPTKRGLVGYLVMSAQGDLKNALASLRRRQQREVPLDSVELRQFARNIDTEEETENELGPVSVSPAANIERSQELDVLLVELAALFDTLADKEMAKLVLQGERDTSAFVRLLGIDGLGINEQRREVKRHKDRIKKRIERWREAR